MAGVGRTGARDLGAADAITMETSAEKADGALGPTSEGAAQAPRSKMIGGSTAFRVADLNAKLDAMDAEGAGGVGAGATTDSAPTSPTGVKYSPKADASGVEKTSVFGKDGKIDPTKVLNSLTQIDTSKKTLYDSSRCGAQTAVAAAVMSKDPKAALGKLADLAGKSENVTDEDTASLGKIKDRMQKGTATHEDLDFIADKLLLAYANDAKDGLVQNEVAAIFRDAGLSKDFQPVLIDISSAKKGDTSGRDGIGDHYVLKGKAPDGTAFYYDPLPLKNKDQVYADGTDGFTKYKAAEEAAAK